MTDAQFWNAILIGAAFVVIGGLVSAIIVAVVLRHRDTRDITTEIERTKVATNRHSEIKDEMRHLQNLTLRAIGGREALESAVRDLTDRMLQHGGRLEEHSERISELREKLGMKVET